MRGDSATRRGGQSLSLEDSLDLELGCGTIEIGTWEEPLAHEGMA